MKTLIESKATVQTRDCYDLQNIRLCCYLEYLLLTRQRRDRERSFSILVLPSLYVFVTISPDDELIGIIMQRNSAKPE
jgi:hypothetical protein